MRPLRPLLVLLALTVAGCSGDDPIAPAIPDSGGASGGEDGGVSACVPGRSVACVCTDGSNGAQVCEDDGTFGACTCVTPDAGTPDSGVTRGLGFEGYPPAVLADCVGSTEDRCCQDAPSGNLGCHDPALTCFRLSSTAEDEEAEVRRTCLRLCEDDADCLASEDNPLCREIRFGQDACVSAEVAEGETANLNRGRGPVTGCANDLSAGGTYLVGVAYYVGSGLWELEHDMSSCVRQCSPSDPSDCTARAPHCTAPFFNSAERPGVCTTARKRTGAPCSRSDGTQMCSRDADTDGRLVCWDYLGQYDDPSRGTCHQLCDIQAQDCSNAHAPDMTPTCLDVLTTSTITGMCSDGCNRHPDSCGGLGSDLPDRSPGVGQNCTYGFFRDSGATIDAPDLAFCYDIVPPLVDPWDFTANGDSCRDRRSSCPDGSYCYADGTTGDAFCVYGCTTSTAAMTSGCEAFGGDLNCRKAGAEEFEAGLCAPF